VKSFDWAIADNSGTTSTAPGFQTLKTTKEKNERNNSSNKTHARQS
jgi:hypothetical protein